MEAPLSKELTFSALGNRMHPPVITDLMTRALENPQLLSLAAGFTDNAILPQELVQEAVDALSSEDPEYLQYGINQGRVGLREETVRWMQEYPGEKSAGFKPSDVLITNGSQQCLYLAMQVLCNPGDLVLVERPTYFVFLEMLRGLGIEAIGIPEAEAGGIDFEGFEDLLERLVQSGDAKRLKATYLVSYFSNPAARCLPEAEKARVAELLTKHGLTLPVLEDAAYRDLYFDEPFPARTIFNLEAFNSFPKLFLGTYTKPLSTGMKIGFGICSEPEWRERMQASKGHQDFGSANLCQRIVEHILREDQYAPFLEIHRRHYREKAKSMHQALLQGALKELGWSWEMPVGGLLFWLRGPDGLETGIGSDFCNTCIDQGVLYVPGELSFTEFTPRNYIRLSFGAIKQDLLAEACRRFCRVAREFSS